MAGILTAQAADFGRLDRFAALTEGPARRISPFASLCAILGVSVVGWGAIGGVAYGILNLVG